MNLSRLRPRTALAGLALATAALSLPAWGQSAEFRRGYDQGYRDGLAAAQQQQGGWRPGPPQGWRAGGISIVEAHYGAQGSYCDAAPALRHALAGPQAGGGVLADNGLCGDPAANRPKALTVVYSCEGRPPQRATVREGDVFYFDCR
ncbi:hypothetical protein [Xylophilus sp.]|uniref:hypothetical protein n=1 Tax=Xylophilus sp. TaxID=2653893 RepID=UPI0013BD59A8|nr:hypothetical protein [Xylophilus sp.]KAF1049407.1 MAG: hypothetical protein GAK38_00863 [Xylophilus sp.]